MELGKPADFADYADFDDFADCNTEEEEKILKKVGVREAFYKNCKTCESCHFQLSGKKDFHKFRFSIVSLTKLSKIVKI